MTEKQIVPLPAPVNAVGLNIKDWLLMKHEGEDDNFSALRFISVGGVEGVEAVEAVVLAMDSLPSFTLFHNSSK